jgi:hypothetical protein
VCRPIFAAHTDFILNREQNNVVNLIESSTFSVLRHSAGPKVPSIWPRIVLVSVLTLDIRLLGRMNVFISARDQL